VGTSQFYGIAQAKWSYLAINAITVGCDLGNLLISVSQLFEW